MIYGTTFGKSVTDPVIWTSRFRLQRCSAAPLWTSWALSAPRSLQSLESLPTGIYDIYIYIFPNVINQLWKCQKKRCNQKGKSEDMLDFSFWSQRFFYTSKVGWSHLGIHIYIYIYILNTVYLIMKYSNPQMLMFYRSLLALWHIFGARKRWIWVKLAGGVPWEA